MKEEIKKEITEVLNAFAQQEIGNKITQFNLQGLATVIMGAIELAYDNAVDKTEDEE